MMRCLLSTIAVLLAVNAAEAGQVQFRSLNGDQVWNLGDIATIPNAIPYWGTAENKTCKFVFWTIDGTYSSMEDHADVNVGESFSKATAWYVCSGSTPQREVVTTIAVDMESQTVIPPDVAGHIASVAPTTVTPICGSNACQTPTGDLQSITARSFLRYDANLVGRPLERIPGMHNNRGFYHWVVGGQIWTDAKLPIPADRKHMFAVALYNRVEIWTPERVAMPALFQIPPCFLVDCGWKWRPWERFVIHVDRAAGLKLTIAATAGHLEREATQITADALEIEIGGDEIQKAGGLRNFNLRFEGKSQSECGIVITAQRLPATRMDDIDMSEPVY
ncbi:MAG: hypothetical protein H6818_05695 [Phycisphaerales bacterium]|nr:hypothetical protein [Phycisphaerales bacterium]MCB9862756.1 hypothetical protein [Phycisphaerales bacterium]